MASWSEFAEAAPALAERVRERLDAHTHKTIATLRADGSPRISGTETQFADGELWIGSMWMAMKALDLRRDPRFALHSGSDDPPDWVGDAKLAGLAEEVEVEPATGDDEGGEHGRSHRFRLDIRAATVVSLNESRDKIRIEHWTPGDGLRVIERE